MTLPAWIGMRGKRGPIFIVAAFVGFYAMSADRLGYGSPVLDGVIFACWAYSALAVLSLSLHLVCDVLAFVAYYRGAAPAPDGLVDVLGGPVGSPRPVDPLAPVLCDVPDTCPACQDIGGPTALGPRSWFCSACGQEVYVDDVVVEDPVAGTALRVAGGV